MSLIWKSEEEMQKELKERIDNWKKGYSRDGYIQRAEGKFNYKGICYLIRVLRYYNHTNMFTNISGEKVSDSHVVVEYPEETKPIVDIVSGIDGVYDFLYHDTNHSHNDNQTMDEQIEECHTLAKEDIDNLLSGEISKKMNEGIKRLQEAKDKLDNVIKDANQVNDVKDIGEVKK